LHEEVNQNNLFLKKKLNELAAMIKEKKRGSLPVLDKIKAKFCLQEGVNPKTASVYLDTLVGAGLVTLYSGTKMWKYNPDQEWDLFSVTPITYRRRGR